MQILIADAGAIPPLVDLVRNGTDAGKEAGAGALGNLAFNDNNKIIIRDAGAIPPLVELLKPGNSNEAHVRLLTELICSEDRLFNSFEG